MDTARLGGQDVKEMSPPFLMKYMIPFIFFCESHFVAMSLILSNRVRDRRDTWNPKILHPEFHPGVSPSLSLAPQMSSSDLSFTPTHLRGRCQQVVRELEAQSEDLLLGSWGCWRLSSCAAGWTPLGPRAVETLGPLLPAAMVLAVLSLSWGSWVSFTCKGPPLTAEESELHALFLSRQGEKISPQGPQPWSYVWELGAE